MIYGNIPCTVVPEFQECNFGKLEGQTYEQIKDDPEYREWLARGGNGTIPGGENVAVFKERCNCGFIKIADFVMQNKIKHSALIVHGGTIMSILEACTKDEQNFFHWQIGNGEGYQVLIKEELWLARKKLYQVSKL